MTSMSPSDAGETGENEDEVSKPFVLLVVRSGNSGSRLTI